MSLLINSRTEINNFEPSDSLLDEVQFPSDASDEVPQNMGLSPFTEAAKAEFENWLVDHPPKASVPEDVYRQHIEVLQGMVSDRWSRHFLWDTRQNYSLKGGRLFLRDKEVVSRTRIFDVV